MSRESFARALRVVLLAILLSTVLVCAPPAVPVMAQDTPPADDPPPDEPGGILKQIFQIDFPISTLWRALEGSILEIVRRQYQDEQGTATLRPMYEKVFNAVVDGDYVEGPGTGVVRARWSVVLGVSAMLWPLTLALNVLVIARGGMTGSITGYADLKEAIISWVVTCALAGMSLLIMGWCRALVGEISTKLLSTNNAEIARAMANMLADEAIVTAVGTMIPGGGVFLLVFFLLLGFAYLIGLCLAFIARYVILYALMVVAPLCITLGSIQATRWLSWLWVKGFAVALLIYPVNAVMIRIAYDMEGTSNVVVRLITFVGALSVIIGVNFSVVNAVFAAAAQIAQMAKETTDQIMSMAIIAAGAIGLGAVAVAGGAAAAGGAAGGGGAAVGGAEGAVAPAAAEGATAQTAATGGGGGGGGGGAPTGAGAAGGNGGGAGQRLRSALSDPEVKRKLGGVARAAGRAMSYTSRSRSGRAAGAMVEGAGGMLGDSGSQSGTGGSQGGRYSAQRDFLDAEGLDPSDPGFGSAAQGMYRVENAYGMDSDARHAVRQDAREVAGMFAAAQADGWQLNDFAGAAGFSNPGEMFGTMMEGRVRTHHSEPNRVFPAAGLTEPSGFEAGSFQPLDYYRGWEMAHQVGRGSSAAAVQGYAHLAHGLRGAGGSDAVAAAHMTAQLNRQNPGKFVGDVEAVAQEYGVELPQTTQRELALLRSQHQPQAQPRPARIK